VIHFGDVSALANVKWFVVITITLSSLVGSPVQVSYVLSAIFSDLAFSGILHLAGLGRLWQGVVRNATVDCRVH
jgi:hypothetical protein